jgi:hypothetical protein
MDRQDDGNGVLHGLPFSVGDGNESCVVAVGSSPPTANATLTAARGSSNRAWTLLRTEAWEQIRKSNDQVKAQGKHDPEILVMFKPLLDFFARGPRPAAPSPAPQATRAS